MPRSQITVHQLSKTYRVPERQAGLGAALKGLFHRQYRSVPAVQAIDFTIDAGEMVAFIGPNGAGKTTTLKMLSGLLYPSAGKARVLGSVPWQREPDYLRRIGMVLGNKSQMLWDIPPLDTFRVLGEIYCLSAHEFQQSLDELVDLLGMEDLLSRPVRNLSLGERMKCELVAGLLHRPEVLFLDEPTLGLDVSMQGRLRTFLREYNRRRDVTVMLTSHYMADVAALCTRVILIHHGRVLYDGDLQSLAHRLAPFKLVQISLRQAPGTARHHLALPVGTDLLEQENGRWTLRVARDRVLEAVSWVLDSLPVADLSVSDPPLEAVIDQTYQEGVA